jgi:hypothetical protein
MLFKELVVHPLLLVVDVAEVDHDIEVVFELLI